MNGIIQWFEDIGGRFYIAFIEKDRYMAYFNGFKMTLFISFFAVIVGVVIGTVLAIVNYSAKRTKGLGFFAALCNIYITVIRGTPVYVQLLIIYFVVFNTRGMPAWFAGILCFGMNSSAYVAEIIRAGIEAVDQGQTEAGRSLGLSGISTMIHIIMPQAVKNILPALGNEFIVLIKETAIIGNISILDVTKAAQNIGMITYDVLPPLLITACIYLVVVVILTNLLRMFERRLARSDRR